MVLLSGIWVNVVMLYMYSLLRHCWVLAFVSYLRYVYVGLNHHSCSKRMFFLRGMSGLRWWCVFHILFLIGRLPRLWVTTNMLGV